MTAFPVVEKGQTGGGRREAQPRCYQPIFLRINAVSIFALS